LNHRKKRLQSSRYQQWEGANHPAPAGGASRFAAALTWGIPQVFIRRRDAFTPRVSFPARPSPFQRENPTVLIAMTKGINPRAGW